MTAPIPFAAYNELQSRFIGLVNQHLVASLDTLVPLRNALLALPEGKQLALLNCLRAEPLKAFAEGPTSRHYEFLNGVVNGHHESIKNPMDPRNDIDWNRLSELAKRNAEVRQVMDLLVRVGFEEFISSYDENRCRKRMSHATDLEYQTSQETHVRCPESQEWMHQTVFHRQFAVNAVGFTGDARHFGEYSGSLPGLLRETGTWLSGIDSHVVLQIYQFGYLLARAEFEEGRIKWAFKAGAPENYDLVTLISPTRFYAVAEDMAKTMGFNNNKRAFLDNDLSL